MSVLLGQWLEALVGQLLGQWEKWPLLLIVVIRASDRKVPKYTAAFYFAPPLHKIIFQ